MSDNYNPFADLGSATAIAEPPPITTEPTDSTEPTKETKPKRATKPSRRMVYIDIETIPDESREHLFDLEPVPVAGPRTPAKDMMTVDELRSGTLDAIKEVLKSRRPDDEYLLALEESERNGTGKQANRKGLFDAIAELRDEATKIEQALAARQKKMATDPEMCRIVALGWAVGGDPAEALVVGQKKADGAGLITETMLLERFWLLVADNTPIVGFNICGFDLPVIFTRSILLDVSPSRTIDLTPWKTDVVDLMADRFPRQQAKRLKYLAALLGIPIPTEDVDGSKVSELFATDPAKVGEYVRSDISVTRELHRKYRGLFSN